MGITSSIFVGAEQKVGRRDNKALVVKANISDIKERQYS
jgi:hypothetical protein